MITLALLKSYWKWGAALALLISIPLGAAWYHAHVYHAGELAQKTVDDARDKRNSDAADAERIVLNDKVAAAQALLKVAQDDLVKLQKDYDDANAISKQRAADLAAGTIRERVLVRAAKQPADPNEPVAGGPAAVLGDDASYETYLDPGVASWLEGIRGERNAAVERLNACVSDYNAVKAAADAMP